MRDLMAACRREPRLFWRALRCWPMACRALRFAPDAVVGPSPLSPVPDPAIQPNPLLDYFTRHTQGRGMWKWTHYFDAYHSHLARFVGRPVRVVEVGILGGGSLEMWAAYFGDQCHVCGIDIQPACTQYARDGVSVLIGDQRDRQFWATFKQKVPEVDVLIDDGGHQPEAQITTLEEMLPHLRPGGVFLCEDIHGIQHPFAAYAAGLVGQLNHMNVTQRGEARCSPSPFQKTVHSIHFYPFLMVIEKHRVPIQELTARKQGTEWPLNRPPAMEH